MNLIKLFQRESKESPYPVIGMSLASGMANAVLLGIINSASAEAVQGKLDVRSLLLFASTFLIFYTGKRFALSRGVMIAEEIVRGVRVRIADKIRNSELGCLEEIGKSTFFTRLTLDTNVVSQSSLIIINACQSAIMVFFCLFYIALLSKLGLLITLVCVGAASFKYLSTRKAAQGELHSAAEKESEFFSLLEHILDGFKEIKVNRKKNEGLFTSFKNLALENERLKKKTGLRFSVDVMAAQVAYYILLAAIIYVLPMFGESYTEHLIRLTASLLFIMGPLDMLVGSIPYFTRANVAIGHLYDLEQKLDGAKQGDAMGKEPPRTREMRSFKEIRMERVLFSYSDKNGAPLFTIGPSDLTIREGEILFVIGGNGSGKSTFLKVLTGLYYPDSGTIKRNGRVVSAPLYQSYRELFTVIFSDFHLFDRLYGLDTIDYDRIDELLKVMELDKKTAVVDGRFTTIDLSTGQRKRLAMLVSLLEDKPICVFDEWAADQDPNFRDFYYNDLLIELKNQGKTIIAVSHDDRYFHVADRVLKMDYGRFTDV